jgi:hypothetical protein
MTLGDLMYGMAIDQKLTGEPEAGTLMIAFRLLKEKAPDLLETNVETAIARVSAM